MTTGQTIDVAAARQTFARLLSRAHRDGDCLLLGSVNRYPPVKIAGRQHPAHRIAFIAEFGPPPADQPFILHSCVDRKHCVSVLHLRAGTRRDNALDAVAAGRIPRGARSRNAVLTARKVRAARAARRRGESTRVIAARLGVKRTTLADALSGRNWGWL